jgi:PAS domain S-box-containing protein
VVARILQVSQGGVAVTDREGTILSVNPAFTAITGYAPEEVLGKNPRVLKSQHHTPDFYEQMWQQLLSEGLWEGEIWNRRKSGEAYPEYLYIAAVYDENEHIHRYVSVFYDLSEFKEMQAQALHHKYHSNLTSLPNRLFLQIVSPWQSSSGSVMMAQRVPLRFCMRISIASRRSTIATVT